MSTLASSCYRAVTPWLKPILLAVFTALILAGQSSVPHDESPKIYLETNSIDFGAVPAETRVTRMVHVHNRGKGLLLITDVRAGCGCTELAIESNKVEPGAFAELRITLSGESTVLNRASSVHLFTNDPEHPVYSLTLLSERSPESFLDPSHIDFGQIEHQDLPARKTCRIICPKETDSPPMSDGLWTASDSAPFLSTTFSHRAHTPYVTICVEVGANAPFGELFYPLSIAAEGGTAVFNTNIVGNVRGWGFALPQSLDFGRLSLRDEVPRQVVQFMSRTAGSVVTVKEVSISESLKGMLSVTPEPKRQPGLVSVGVNSRGYTGLWSARTYVGYFKALCADSHGSEHWIAVPVRFRAIDPRHGD